MASTAQLGTSDSRPGNIVLGLGSELGDQPVTGSCEILGGGAVNFSYARTTQLLASVIYTGTTYARTTQLQIAVIYRILSASGVCEILGGGTAEPAPQANVLLGAGALFGTSLNPVIRGALYGAGALFGECAVADLVHDHVASGSCEIVGGGSIVKTVHGVCEIGGYGALMSSIEALATPCLSDDGQNLEPQNYVF